MMRSLLLVVAALSCATPVMADLALAKTRSCMACHGVDKKLVGPAFQDIAQRYADQGDAAPLLAQKIMQGSKGAWGPVPMPANNQVSPAEAQRLSEWVLSLK